jgi:hypothetical protein
LCQFCGAALTGKGAQQSIRYQVRGPMTTGASTVYKITGGFWLLSALFSVFTSLQELSRPPTVIPASKGAPAMIINPWSVTGPVVAIFSLAGLIAIGMIANWDWARPWAKFLGWVGIFSGVLCLIPAALLKPEVGGSFQMAAVRSVLFFIMSIVTLWALKETS